MIWSASLMCGVSGLSTKRDRVVLDQQRVGVLGVVGLVEGDPCAASRSRQNVIEADEERDQQRRVPAPRHAATEVHRQEAPRGPRGAA